MKTKKTKYFIVMSVIAVMIAGVLSIVLLRNLCQNTRPLNRLADTEEIGVTTIAPCASPILDKQLCDKLLEISNTTFTDEDYNKLLALQFEGYENMTVADYREKACTIIDADYPDYMRLLERMYQDRPLAEMRYKNEAVSFLYNTLAPLIFENWREVIFCGYADSLYSSPHREGGRLEYTITRTILDPDRLTVGEHDITIQSIMEALQAFITAKHSDELQDEDSMSIAIKTELEHLISEWGSQDLNLSISYIYTPLVLYPKTDTTSKAADDERGTPGSQEDYNSILALKTADYKNQSVADFNHSLLMWANQNEEISGRIVEDLAKNDIRVKLTDEELSFLTITVSISNAQNANMIRSQNTGKPETDLIMQYRLTTDEDVYVWLWYKILIKISNESELTIGERDKYLSNVIIGMQSYWNSKEFDEIAVMKEEVFEKLLTTLVNQNSNNLIKIEIHDLSFQGA